MVVNNMYYIYKGSYAIYSVEVIAEGKISKG